MTILQKRKILTKVVNLEKDIEALRECRKQICATGYASATLSSGGGSKSYTRLDIGKITEAINEMTTELDQYKVILSAGRPVSPFKLGSVLTVYS